MNASKILSFLSQNFFIKLEQINHRKTTFSTKINSIELAVWQNALLKLKKSFKIKTPLYKFGQKLVFERFSNSIHSKLFTFHKTSELSSCKNDNQPQNSCSN